MIYYSIKKGCADANYAFQYVIYFLLKNWRARKTTKHRWSSQAGSTKNIVHKDEEFWTMAPPRNRNFSL